MLDSFREKIQNVQHDISNGFRHLLAIDDLSSIIIPIVESTHESTDHDYSTQSSLSSPFIESQSRSDSINLRAGIPVLNHFQNKWQRIHLKGEQNLKMLQEANGYADEILNYCQRRQKVLDAFLNVYLHFNGLKNAADEIEQDLDRLFEQITIAEKLRKSLEQNRHEQNMIRLQNEHELRFGEHTERLQREFEQFRQILETDHQKKAREQERRLLARNQQQREQFRALFEADLDEYRRTGKLPPRTDPLSSKSTHHLNMQNANRIEISREMAKSTKIANLEVEIDLNESNDPNVDKSTLEQIEVEPDESDQMALNEFLS